MRRRITSALLCLGVAACGGEPDTDVDSAGWLVGATETYDRPEVGRFRPIYGGNCTATLLAPNVAITAAHCVGYRTGGPTAGEIAIGSFMVVTGRQEVHFHRVDEARVFGSQVGATDVALLHLGQSVPAHLATPARLAGRMPEDGERLTLYGFGCTNRSRTQGDYIKRKKTYRLGEGGAVCPGDSGGPGFAGPDGPLVTINSGYNRYSTRDVFAFPVALGAALRAQVAAWSGGSREPDPVEPEPEPVEPEPEPVEPDPVEPDPVPEPAPSDCLGGSSAAAATPLTGARSGRVCADRDSWLSIEADGPIEVTVRFEHTAGDIDVELQDASGGAVDRSTSTSDEERVRRSEAGRSLLRIYGYRGAANDVSVTLD